MQDAASTAASAARILVVDDEVGMRTLLQTLLESEGYVVEAAASGEDAAEMLQAREYEVLVTDLKMPGIDGLELVERARRAQPNVAVVMVTGYATVENTVAALRQGVDDYLTKPFDIEELRQTVARTLRNRRLREQDSKVLTHLCKANTELRALKGRLEHEVTSAHQSLLTINASLEKHRRELETLSGVSQALTSTLDPEQLLDTCLGLVTREMGVEKASIMLLESGEEPSGGAASLVVSGAGARGSGEVTGSEESGELLGGELVVKASIGPSAVDIVGERVHLGEGIAGWVARQGKPLLIENVNATRLGRQRWVGPDGRALSRRQYKNVSLVCVPLAVKGRVLGVINVNDKTNGQPFTREDVSLLSTIAGQIAVTIENARLYEELQVSAFRTVQALVVTLEAKDTYTSGHSQRVTDYACSVGRRLLLPAQELAVLRYASQLHDIGKIGITEDILHKPGPLNETEWRVIRSHPVISERIIQPLHFLEGIKGVVRHHHERWDGTGYPDGLRGEDLSLLTRILGVADAYDAMTSQRPYRLRPFRPEEAVGEIRRCEGIQFDPQVVKALGDGAAFVEMHDLDQSKGPRAPERPGT